MDLEEMALEAAKKRIRVPHPEIPVSDREVYERNQKTYAGDLAAFARQYCAMRLREIATPFLHSGHMEDSEGLVDAGEQLMAIAAKEERDA